MEGPLGAFPGLEEGPQSKRRLQPLEELRLDDAGGAAIGQDPEVPSPVESVTQDPGADAERRAAPFARHDPLERDLPHAGVDELADRIVGPELRRRAAPRPRKS